MRFLAWLVRQWWFWCLALVALPGLGLLVCHWTGESAWRREQEAVRTAGGLVTFADVVARAPAVDAQRQLRLWQLNQRVFDGTWWLHSPDHRHPLAELWCDDRKPYAYLTPEELAAYRAGSAEIAAEFTAICRSGPVLAGSAGWLQEDFPAGVRPTVRQLWSLRRLSGPTLKALFEVGISEIAAGAPEPALQRFDALLAASAVICGVEDAMAHLHIVEYRDALHLKALALGRLDPARCAAWLREPSDACSTMAAGLLGQRAELPVLLAEGRFDLREWGAGYARWFSTPHKFLEPLLDEAFRAHSATRWSQLHRAVAQVLDGGPLPPELGPGDDEDGMTWGKRRFSDLASYLTRNIMDLPAFSLASVSHANRHREVRAAARALIAWRNGGLPADQAAAEALMGADLHADARVLPPLVYERLSPTRFRLGIDPTGPLPLFSARGWLSRSPRPGAPPGMETCVLKGWSLELDCAGLPPAPVGDSSALMPPACACRMATSPAASHTPR